MKKLLRNVTFLCLLTVSLASYFFLEVQHYRNNQALQIEEPMVEQAEQTTPWLPAPDVFLVKKVVETARRFVPTSTVAR